MVTVIPVITTAIILATILISGRINEFNERITEKGQNIVDYLAPISEFGVISRNFGYMKSTLDHTTKLSEIAAIYILDHEDHIIVSHINPSWKNADLTTADESFRIFSSTISKTETSIDDMGLTTAPEKISEIIGSVKLKMSLTQSKMRKQRIIKDGLFITLISTIITTLIALLFARSVTRPITLINNGVNKIKKGNLDYRIPIDYKGEIADLAQGINNMSSSLEISQIKEKQRAEDALFIEKTKAHITLAAIGDGVITTDTDGNITYINPAAEYLTGFNLKNAINKPLSSIFKIKESTTNKIIDYPIMECIKSTKKLHHESDYILIREDETEYAIRETATPLFDKEKNVVGAVLVFHDFSNIKKMSDVLTYQATHDDLTALLNRRAFESKLNSIIYKSLEDDNHSLCYIDLDQFKIVNDTCGHIAGDNLLKLVANTINEKIRKNDLFARLGGDEFGLVFFDCDIKKAKTLAENIKETISRLVFTWETHSFKIGCSIGLVPITINSNLTDMMMAADAACYIAKDKGRNRIHIYKTDDDIVTKKKGELQWFQRINHALENNSFELYSQKIASHSKNRKHQIHEVLLRMNENDEIISSAAFIPAAERYSLMPKIDKWVISSLFDKIQTNRSQQNDLIFSINLSGQSLTDDTFSSFLKSQLEQTNIPPESLIFEITETSAISNFLDAVEFIWLLAECQTSR